MILCDSVQFSRPVLVDPRDPRTGFQTSTGIDVYYEPRNGQVIIVSGGKWVAVVPPEGSVIRGLWPMEEMPLGQQQPAPSASAQPARPIQKSGRVQR